MDAVDEYFRERHAEPVPLRDLSKPNSEVFCLPMHAVCKDTSTTPKLRVAFDASAKSSMGISLNDQPLVFPMVHALLLDMLLRFRRHKIVLATDISLMYHAIFSLKISVISFGLCGERMGAEKLKILE